MLKTALRIAAVLAALLSPSLAAAQSYELLFEGAGQQTRPACLGRPATLEYLRALHFQMTVRGKTYEEGTIAIRPRMGGRGNLECYYLNSSAEFRFPPNIIDVVELDGLGPWSQLTMYGVEAIKVTNHDGRIMTREIFGNTVYVIVSDYFVRKRP